MTFPDVASTAVANFLPAEQIMHPGIGPLCTNTPRVVGPAFIVQCAQDDNLMMHAAIYRAQEGDVVVAHSGDSRLALAGGNVCAVAQQRGIAGFIAEGYIRDIGEVREMEFPVYALGAVPKPGTKKKQVAATEVTVGGVVVHNGDIIVADEDGIAVLPADQAEELIEKALAHEAKESAAGLAGWEANHRKKVTEGLEAGGDTAGLPE